MLNNASRATSIVWDPRKKQTADLDTTFGPLDPAVEAARGAPIATGAAGGNRADLGGFILANDATAPSVVPGKYRQAIDATSATNGFAYALLDGVLPTKETTVEALVTADAAWETLTAQAWTLGAGNDYWQFLIDSGHLSVTIGHSQNPANFVYTFAATYTLPTSTYAAGTAYSVAATLDQAGVLSLILEAAVVATNSGFVAPITFGQSAIADGIKLPGGFGSATATHLTIEGVKVSRKKRAPLVKQARPTGRNTIVVASTNAGATVAALNGIVKPLTGGTNAPLYTAKATAKAQNAISTVRDDKVIACTPILAGGTPDAAHPTVGQSGAFCYDWELLDRTMAMLIGEHGAVPYLSLNSTPSILGGSPTTPFTSNTYTTTASTQIPDAGGKTLNVTTSVVESLPVYIAAPIVGGGTNYYIAADRLLQGFQQISLVSGTPGASVAPGTVIRTGKLAAGFAYASTFNKQTPNNLTSWAQICADFVHRIRTELGYTQAVYFGLWNEPDQGTAWSDTSANWFAMWKVWFQTIKAMDSSVKLCGPEISFFGGTNATNWIQPFLAYGAANACYPDAVSFHNYSGFVPDMVNVSLQLAQYAVALSKPVPELILGEWGWSQSYTNFSPGKGKWPWVQPSGLANAANPAPTPQPGRTDYAGNSYNAAFHAARMILLQQLNVLAAAQPTVYAPFKFAQHYTGNDVSMFDANSVPQALYNVSRMWGMILGGQVLNISSDDLPPGVRRLAVKVGSQVLVLLASLHYRKTRPNGSSTHTISIDVSDSAFGFTNSTPVTTYTVDDLTANAYDTQGATSVLTPTSSTVSSGKVSTSLRMQAVQLVVIG